jgi:hypothetical protein
MAVVGRSLRDLAGKIGVPSIGHRLPKRRHGGIARAGPANDRGQCKWRRLRNRKAKCAKPVQADSGTGVRHHRIGDRIHSRLLPLQHASEPGDGAR